MSMLSTLRQALGQAILFRYRCGALVRWQADPGVAYEVTQQRATMTGWGLLRTVRLEYVVVVHQTGDGTGEWVAEDELTPWRRHA